MLDLKTEIAVDKLPEQFDIKVWAKKEKKDFIFNTVPGDKSITQRAIVLNALGKGEAKIIKPLRSKDIESCIAILQELGVHITWQDENLYVKGVGLKGLKATNKTLNIGNTATSARLILSLLASCPFETTLTGNALLSKRPMKWVVEPLIKMGARIQYLNEEGCLPLVIKGINPLKSIHVDATVVSAQEKSALLFAALNTDGITSYKQRCQSRDHTERLFEYFNLPIKTENELTKLQGGQQFKSKDVIVPSDISSAAFMIGAYLLRDSRYKGDLSIDHVGVNETRLGIYHVLKSMGIAIELVEKEMVNFNEPVAQIRCQSSDAKPKSFFVEGDAYVQSLIDEVPILSAIAALADGESILFNCEELKDKDTNRIETTANVLKAFGVNVDYSAEYLKIKGGKFTASSDVKSYGDHRLAMTAAVIASSLEEPSIIRNCACMAISYPTFLQDLAQFAHIEVIPT